MGVRKQSATLVLNQPLWAVAFGPDPEAGEPRGHARGIIAVGDIATGWLAAGWVARGGIAIGAVAVGGIAFGGVGCGLVGVGGCAAGFLAVGGCAFGAVALGGVAVGLIAAGAVAAGYYALGAVAAGARTYSVLRHDPEAAEFFRRWFPFLMSSAMTGVMKGFPIARTPTLKRFREHVTRMLDVRKASDKL